MATSTTNYNLSKPSYSDTADIAVINENMDKIDAAIKNVSDTASTNATNISALQQSVSKFPVTGKPEIMKNLTSSEWAGFLPSVDGLYFVRAINLGVSGVCTALMAWNYTGDDDSYISANESPEGAYKRATTAPVFLKAGVGVAVRAMFTSSGAVCRIK